MPRIKILGVEIDNLKESEVFSILRKYLESRNPHQVVTLNPEIISEAGADSEYKNILNKADLALPDGFGLKLASYYLKNRLKQRITGTDLMVKLCQVAAKNNYSVYLLGAKGEIAEIAAKNLIKKFPSLKIVGTENGFRFWGIRLSDHKIVEKINRARPDILFVAFGAPKQEKWLFHCLPSLKTVKIGIGVGGAFDFISGKVKRAPPFLRKIGLEWLWRLILQPWRLPRIFNATARFTLKVIKSKKQKHE